MSGSSDLLMLDEMLTLRRNDGLSDDLEAMREIVEAWRGGRLELTAEHHEMTERADKPARKVLEPNTYFSELWDWHSSRVLGKINDVDIDFRRIGTTRAKFDEIFCSPKSKWQQDQWTTVLSRLFPNGVGNVSTVEVCRRLRDTPEGKAKSLTLPSRDTVNRMLGRR